MISRVEPCCMCPDRARYLYGIADDDEGVVGLCVLHTILLGLALQLAWSD